MAPLNSVNWAPFTATEIHTNGKRAIRLVAQDFRQKPKIINLVVQQELPGFKLFPAAYEYIDVPLEGLFDLQSQRQSALRIVAAPGVSVHLENWPDDSPTLLEVIRVQDPNVVPPQATSILSDFYALPPEISLPSLLPSPFTDSNLVQISAGHFRLEQKASGLTIRHPYSTNSLVLEYVMTSRSITDAQDAKTRFCYQIIPVPGQTAFQELSGFGESPTFAIVKTPNIKATLQGGRPRLVFTQDPSKNQRYNSPFRIFEAPDITSIPPQGAEVVLRPGWKEVTLQTSRNRDWFDDESYVEFRMIVSLLPVVPVLLDIGEFMLASATGKDFQGRELTGEEILSLGLVVVLDFLPMSVEALFKAFKRSLGRIMQARLAIKAANVTAEERLVLKKVEETIKRGQKMTKKQFQTVAGVLERMKTKYPPLETLLNADESGFVHAELQGGYETYRTQQVKLNKTPASPKDWAKSNTRGRYSEILVKLLGPDYRKSSAQTAAAIEKRIFNILEIMKPSGYTTEIVQEHLKFVLAQKKLLGERLRPLLAELKSADQAVAYMARNQISSGRLNNVKGVIGEIFAFPMQQKILRESHSHALLFTDVRIQRAGAKSSVLFTDNVIAILKGNDIELKVVFEVKAGKAGGAEATTQIFKWIEEKLADGDQLIIPKGSKYYDAKEVEKTLATEIRAYYQQKPSVAKANAGSGVVLGLASADRKIIASKGTSLLGLSSEEQVAPKVERLDLPVTSSEIDYLSGQLVQELGRSSLP